MQIIPSEKQPQRENVGLGPNVLCLTNSCFRWGNGIQRMTRSLHRWYNSHRSVDEERMKVRINPAHCVERGAHGFCSDKVSDSQIGTHGSDNWCPGKTIWELTTCGLSPWWKKRCRKICMCRTLKITCGNMIDWSCLHTCVAAFCPPWRPGSEWFGHRRPLVDPQCRTHTLYVDLQLNKGNTSCFLILLNLIIQPKMKHVCILVLNPWNLHKHVRSFHLFSAVSFFQFQLNTKNKVTTTPTSVNLHNKANLWRLCY